MIKKVRLLGRLVFYDQIVFFNKMNGKKNIISFNRKLSNLTSGLFIRFLWIVLKTIESQIPISNFEMNGVVQT